MRLKKGTLVTVNDHTDIHHGRMGVVKQVSAEKGSPPLYLVVQAHRERPQIFGWYFDHSLLAVISNTEKRRNS